MVDISYEDDVLRIMQTLDEPRRKQVWEFVRGLVDRPRGTPGWLAIEIADKINFPPEDLDEIRTAIEEAKEIDLDGWDLPA
jgi:hypothetical protein